MRSASRTGLAATVVALAGGTAALAAPRTWTTPTTGDWSDPTRWTPMGVPTGFGALVPDAVSITGAVAPGSIYAVNFATSPLGIVAVLESLTLNAPSGLTSNRGQLDFNLVAGSPFNRVISVNEGFDISQTPDSRVDVVLDNGELDATDEDFESFIATGGGLAVVELFGDRGSLRAANLAIGSGVFFSPAGDAIPSDATVLVVRRATEPIGPTLVGTGTCFVGRNGGVANVTVERATAAFNPGTLPGARLNVGDGLAANFDPVSGVLVVPSLGQITVYGQNAVLDLQNGSPGGVGQDVLTFIGSNGGNGSISNFSSFGFGTPRGRILLGRDPQGASFVCGTDSVPIGGSSEGQRSSGSIFIEGDGPFSGDPDFHADGNGFVGVRGGFGSLTLSGGDGLINGDLVVGDSVTVFPPPTFNRIPGDGIIDIGGNGGRLIVTGNIFAGQNEGIAKIYVGDSGDGPFGQLFADNIFLGGGDTPTTAGSGSLFLESTGSTTVGRLFINATTQPLGGGFASLDTDHRLFVNELDADGEGDRFTWNGGDIILNGNGTIINWGAANLTIPTFSRLSGDGTVEPATICQGVVDVGYESGPDENLSITFENAFSVVDTDPMSTFDNPFVILSISYPTRSPLAANQQLVFLDAVAFAGDLLVDLDPDSGWFSDVQAGDSFPIFSYAGGPPSTFFESIWLPFLPADFTWGTDRLYTTGEIYIIGPGGCVPDFNGDTSLNDDDLSEFITAYFEILPGPGGYAQPCPGADFPFNINGYRADVTGDCSLNDDDLSLFITLYFIGCE